MSCRAKILGNLLSFHILIILLKNIHTLKRRRFYSMWNLCQTFHAMGDHRRCAHSDCVAHGRKTKSESFASCRVSISGGSKIAWINVECNEDSLSQFLPKLESVRRPARLLLFPPDKFVVRRQLKRLRKNRNCSLAQESIHLAAVTLTADGCVNNIKFASYLTGNRSLTCKRITKRQRPSNTRTIFHIMHLKAWIRDSRKEKPKLAALNVELKNVQIFKYA